jgi:ParB-like chromosome segregation protein Spo0J
MQLYKIKDVKVNPSNPRIIRDDKFAKLVESLKEFPEMATIRPIVCNTDMVILGGNMRFKAMQAAGWKEVPVQVVDWPEDKQAEFVIKDNVSGGEWDWDMLANQWDAEKLEAWGLDVPVFMESGDIVELDKIVTTYNLQIKCDTPEELEELKFQLGISSNSIHASMLKGLLA